MRIFNNNWKILNIIDVKTYSLKYFILLLGFLVFIPTQKLDAIDYKGRLSFGGSLGTAFPVWDGFYKDNYNESNLASGYLEYGMSNTFSLVGSYSFLELESKLDNSQQRFQPVQLAIRYHPFHHTSVITPYLVAGNGIAFNRTRVLGGTSDNWTRMAARGGIGIEIFINPVTSISAEGNYHYIEGRAGESPFRFATVMGGLRIYFGEALSTKIAKKSQEKTREELMQEQAAAEMARRRAEEAQRRAEQESQRANQAEQGELEAQRLAEETRSAAQRAQAEIAELKEMMRSKQLNPIKFQLGSSELDVSSYETLDYVANIAKKYPALNLHIEGHTDGSGSDVYNLRLSQLRADSVRQYLVQESALPSNKVESSGMGETRPIASNATRDGRALNRRVEFLFSIPR